MKKRRNQSFIGLHFDFHADPAQVHAAAIGERTTEQSIEAVIQAVGPDFIQCDSKGHPGWSSYPTKAGLPYPDIIRDPLRVWREVTERYGIALYVHYSGVVDTQACRRHPDWARVTPERVTDVWATSTFGPYADKLLIPQISEMAGEYGIDGVWIDGDCWGTQADYSQSAMNRFATQTGIDLTIHPPVKPEDPHFHEFRDFCREQFRIYLRHYLDILHSRHPSLQIASNWAFSSVMPEAVSAAVDFLSGDYTPTNSVNSARFEGRYLAAQGLPWDLMAWGFSLSDSQDRAFYLKDAAQLKQEAASVIALGGGFQCYLAQRSDGSVRVEQAAALGEVFRFCRERQPYCHQAAMVPQVALLYATTEHYKKSKYLFQSDQTETHRGLTQLLCETQHALEIRSEHNLKGITGRWPVIVIPEICDIDPDLYHELIEYVHQGGSLFLAGPGSVALFAQQLDIQLAPVDSVQYLSLDGVHWAAQTGLSARITNPVNGIKVGLRSGEQDGDGEPSAAAVVLQMGKGLVACLPMDIGFNYQTKKSSVLRSVFGAVMVLLYQPIVRVSGSVYVDVVVLHRNNHLLIQLVNTAGPHDQATWRSFDEIPPIGPLQIAVTLQAVPQSVMQMPGNKPVEGIWADGCYRFELDRLELHEIIYVEM